MVFQHDFKQFPELTNAQLALFQFSSPHKQILRDFDAEIVKVHDGDTVTARVDFRDFDFPVRLSSIDAPELNEGGDVARDWLEGQILGKKVMVLVDFNNRVGKYGRLLGTILNNGMSVGDEMMHLGLVKPFGSKNEGSVPDVYRWIGDSVWA